jgi:hypothetical protein
MKRICIAVLLFAPVLALPARYSVIAQAAAENVPPAIFQPPSPIAVGAYVRQETIAYGVNPTDALWIVSYESQDGRNMRGDDGQSRGYWMISDIWHPEVSTACADDLQCSTAWSLKWILAGHIDQWSTWRVRFQWYADQNPPL